MTTAVELWQRGAAELAALYLAGGADPVATLESVLARVTAVNPSVNAIVTLDAQGARAAAMASRDRWARREALGPLDGVPLTVKDNLFVGGMRATWGSRLHADHVAPRDDVPVAALRAAGAVILGKTNTPELALSGSTDNLIFGPTGNPWDVAASPGGSSGGAVAALAGGMGPLALATDAGGSIRRPAGHAGVVGLKPGIGRVPRRHGFPPLAQDLQVVGPLARSVEDVRLMFGVIAVGNGSPGPLKGLRIAACASAGEAPVDLGVQDAFGQALMVLAALGHRIEPSDLPGTRAGGSPLWRRVVRGRRACRLRPSELGGTGDARHRRPGPGWAGHPGHGLPGTAGRGGRVPLAHG
jgi:aspartyl-tRNA(Asn)/glutamyl-tRNA(Gln) amidotransferase subunit A